MKNNSPKYLALKTLIKHKCYSLNNCDDLKHIIESNQFTIIEYKKYTNSQHVSELIKKLKIEKEIEQNDSFLYINNNLRFVFVNASVSDEEKCALLRHELGHICDPSFKNRDINYSNIQKEEFANEFSCFAKKPPISFKLQVFIAKKWKLLVGLFVLIVVVSTFAFIMNTTIISHSKSASGNVLSDSTYYVTSAGKKYHRNHCFIIKYKNNLTQINPSDALQDGYEPCKVCNTQE